eukprot:scaffold1033_cov408-Prasinococcus_capsulatus_cf.AAC.15
MAMTRWIFALGCVGMYFCLRTTLMSTGTSKGIASIGLERSDLIRKAEVPLITTEVRSATERARTSTVLNARFLLTRAGVEPFRF